MSSPNGPPGSGQREGQQPPSPNEPRGQDGPPTPWMPPNASKTPNAEKYLLEAEGMRRRQMRSALLHGSGRTWRENRRIWPAIVAGVVVVALILAVFGVMKALQQSADEKEQEQQQQQQNQSAPVRSAPTTVPAQTFSTTVPATTVSTVVKGKTLSTTVPAETLSTTVPAQTFTPSAGAPTTTE
ncbi:MAG: hypothetical protein ACRDQA_32280 [Nocardioidaceae bacterium]